MADTLSNLFDFTLPEVGGSDDSWGDKLNANFTKVDTVLAAAFPSGVPTGPGQVFRVTGSLPEVQFAESDQTDPAGRFRLSVQANMFNLQKANTISWGSFSTLWRYRGDINQIEATSNYAFLGGLRLKDGATATGIATMFRQDATNFTIMFTASGDADGAFNALRPFMINKATGAVLMQNGVTSAELLTVNGVQPELRIDETDQTDPAGRFRFIASSNYFSCQKAATAAWATATTIWRYRGDNGQLETSVPLALQPGGSALRIKDLTTTAGIATLLRQDSAAFYIMLTASGDADGTYNALRPFTINKTTGVVSMLNGVVANEGLSLGSVSAASVTDLSKHLTIWGTTYGLSVMGAAMVYEVPGAAGHDFYRGSTHIARFGNGLDGAALQLHGDLRIQTDNIQMGNNIFSPSVDQTCSQLSTATLSLQTANATSGTASAIQLYRGADSNLVFQVVRNGAVKNVSGTITAISDPRLKTNIEDATPKLDDLNRLRVINYELIGANAEFGKLLGFSADEVEEVFPKLVDVDEETGIKGVKWSVMVPMLVKAVQELTAQVQELKAGETR